MSEIYQSAEDSYLMQKSLKQVIKNPDIKFLEIGCGSGILLQTARKLGVKNIFGVDISSKAVKSCKDQGFNCKKSNLFSNIKGKFNLIIFNPPYLPKDKREPKNSQTATTGGEKGFEIINKFLKQSKKHLTKKGKILILISSLTKNINWQGYKKKLILQKKMFFEELKVFSLHP